nr:hypothetical protein [Pseudoalteromonas sp. T1lg21]
MAASNTLKVKVSLETSELQQAINGAVFIVEKLPKNIFGYIVKKIIHFIFYLSIKFSIRYHAFTTDTGDLIVILRIGWILKLFTSTSFADDI